MLIKKFKSLDDLAEWEAAHPQYALVEVVSMRGGYKATYQLFQTSANGTKSFLKNH